MALTQYSWAVVSTDHVPTYDVTMAHDHTVLWLGGDHDAASASDLVFELARISPTDGRDVVVDLSGVLFISSATVHAIVDARLALSAQGRALTLRDPSACARRFFALASLDYSSWGTDSDAAIIPIGNPGP